MLKATPQCLGPWLVSAAAPHKPPELREPAHGLAKRRWTVRRYGTVMDGTIKVITVYDQAVRLQTRGITPGQCAEDGRGLGGLEHAGSSTPPTLG